MRILSHRGFWLSASEKNSPEAFTRSFDCGFGTETDLRDLDGQLVIAHDPPRAGNLAAAALFAVHAANDAKLPLAINIKSDGLQPLMIELLEKFTPRDVFVFDMSIPDMLGWLRTGIPVFTRHSDVEPEPVLVDRVAGVWLDGFNSDWWDEAVVRRHLDAGRRVCIVSPELHRRNHRSAWERLAASDLPQSGQLMLCTDYPADGMELFGNEN